LPRTPLLADKLTRGYPHVLIEFREEAANLPGAVYLRYNAKAWRHRDDFSPVGDAAGKEEFLAEWCRGRFPSAELLVEGELPLDPLAAVIRVVTAWEGDWLENLRIDLGLTPGPPIQETRGLFPPCAPYDEAPFVEYANRCRAAGRVLPPPDLPFD
jgi:hypothetical protein